MPIGPSGGSGGAGGLTKLFDSTLGAPALSIDTGAGGIAGGHVGLIVYLYARTDRAANANDSLLILFNNDSGANYDVHQVIASNTTLSATPVAAATKFNPTCAASTAAASVFTQVRIDVFNYDGTVGFKQFSAQTADAQQSAAGFNTEVWSGEYRSTSAISRMSVASGTGSNLITGTRLMILGIQ